MRWVFFISYIWLRRYVHFSWKTVLKWYVNVYVFLITGYNGEEQCNHSLQHLQAVVLLYGREGKQFSKENNFGHTQEKIPHAYLSV